MATDAEKMTRKMRSNMMSKVNERNKMMWKMNSKMMWKNWRENLTKLKQLNAHPHPLPSSLCASTISRYTTTSSDYTTSIKSNHSGVNIISICREVRSSSSESSSVRQSHQKIARKKVWTSSKLSPDLTWFLIPGGKIGASHLRIFLRLNMLDGELDYRGAKKVPPSEEFLFIK